MAAVSSLGGVECPLQPTATAKRNSNKYRFIGASGVGGEVGAVPTSQGYSMFGYRWMVSLA